MSENKDRLGLLLIFDCIAVLLTTFGAAVVLSLMSGGIDRNLMIVCCFFVGIKILVMGIGDITGITRRFWAGAIFILIADVIIVMVDILMAFGISSRFFMVTLGLDVIFIILSHLLWQKFFGIPIADLKAKKEWLSDKGGDDEEQAEIDDIFSSLSDQDQDGLAGEAVQALDEPAQGATLFDGLKEPAEPLAAAEALPDLPPSAITQEIPTETIALAEKAFDDLNVKSETGIIEIPKEAAADAAEPAQEAAPAQAEEASQTPGSGFLFEAQPADDEAGLSESPQAQEETDEAAGTTAETTVPEEEPTVIFKPITEAAEALASDHSETPAAEAASLAPLGAAALAGAAAGGAAGLGLSAGSKDAQAQETAKQAKEPAVESGELAELEDRLGQLMTEVGTDDRDTTNLSKAVDSFKSKLAELDPLVDDEDIVTTGTVVREKLQNIIDKQSLVDEVLDDLIRLSQQINARIDDLDELEAELNRRKKELDRKERRAYGEDEDDGIFNFGASKVAISPEEVLLDNGDSEIIVDGDDFDLIKAYLSQNPNL